MLHAQRGVCAVAVGLSHQASGVQKYQRLYTILSFRPYLTHLPQTASIQDASCLSNPSPSWSSLTLGRVGPQQSLYGIYHVPSQA